MMGSLELAGRSGVGQLARLLVSVIFGDKIRTASSLADPQVFDGTRSCQMACNVIWTEPGGLVSLLASSLVGLVQVQLLIVGHLIGHDAVKEVSIG